MLNVVAAEADSFVLGKIKSLLDQAEGVNICGLFSTQEKLIEYIISNSSNMDILLLDADMPGMDGMQIVEWIANVACDIEIILISDCEKHAIKAFELGVRGYLLKPICSEKLKRVLKKIADGKNRLTSNNISQEQREKRKIVVQCFGQFKVSGNGKNENIKWRNSKSEELLALLIQEKGIPVTKDYIIDKLWSEKDPDKASINLNTVVYQLRRNLLEMGIDDFVENIKSTGTYFANTEKYFCDAHEFERYAKLFYKQGNIETAEKALSMYTGEYLSMKDFAWAQTQRWYLEKLVFEILEALYGVYEKCNSKKAEEILIKMMELNLHDEESYQRLIEYYKRQNNKKAARNIKEMMLANALY